MLDDYLSIMLEDAEKSKDKFGLLGIAIDYAKENEQNELANILRWLRKHKKFPRIDSKEIKFKVTDNLKFDEKEVARNFFEEVLKRKKAKKISLDNELQQRVESAREEAISKCPDGIKISKTYYFVVSDSCDKEFELPKTHFAAARNRRIMQSKDWDTLLLHLASKLNDKFEWFNLE